MRHPTKPHAIAVAILLVSGLNSALAGQDPPPKPTPTLGDSIQVYLLDPLTVRGRIDDLTGAVGSASVGFVGAADLRLRPLMREAELLETVPGMILSQHSGSGKSNQIFVRGFNLDHGTDFSTWIEGMPVNIPSHAHGQGYTDLNFIIPEFVDHIEYSLGNYYADIGDFGSAGGARLRLRRSLARPLFEAGFGENGFQRVVAAAPAQIGANGSLIVGGEYKGYDGPWERPEQLQKLSGMARYVWQGTTQSVSFLALGYDNSWDASDQIPRRSVDAGVLSRFGQIDQTLGGASSRYSLSSAWERSTGAGNQRIDAYAIHYDLDLFSNFTYLLDNESEGDQIRQQDRGRWSAGANATHRQSVTAGGVKHAITLGGSTRWDWADVSLSRTNNRQLLSTVRRDDVFQWSAATYTEIESAWSPVFRTMAGVRADVHGFDVTSDRPANSGTASDALVSPKLSVALGPWANTEFYVSAGLGYHSNDARGVVQTVDPETESAVQAVDPLVRSTGAELGLRSTPVEGLRSTLALWTIRLDSELLFVGDAGNTEPSDPSARVGVTWANFYRVGNNWIADFDVSVTEARFQNVPAAENRIPGALENVVAAGLSYSPPAGGPFAALRVRRFGSYPLIEDNSERANANSLLNLNVGYQLGDVRVTVSILNLLNEEHSDIQYFYPSRLGGEPAGGVDDVHFHPAEPRQIRIGLSWGS